MQTKFFSRIFQKKQNYKTKIRGRFPKKISTKVFLLFFCQKHFFCCKKNVGFCYVFVFERWLFFYEFFFIKKVFLLRGRFSEIGGLFFLFFFPSFFFLQGAELFLQRVLFDFFASFFFFKFFFPRGFVFFFFAMFFWEGAFVLFKGGCCVFSKGFVFFQRGLIFSREFFFFSKSFSFFNEVPFFLFFFTGAWVLFFFLKKGWSF